MGKSLYAEEAHHFELNLHTHTHFFPLFFLPNILLLMSLNINLQTFEGKLQDSFISFIIHFTNNCMKLPFYRIFPWAIQLSLHIKTGKTYFVYMFSIWHSICHTSCWKFVWTKPNWFASTFHHLPETVAPFESIGFTFSLGLRCTRKTFFYFE